MTKYTPHFAAGAHHGQCLIDGRWVAGEGEAWQRFSPMDESLVWEGGLASEDQLQTAVAAAAKAFPLWSERALDERLQLCRHFADFVSEHKESLAHTIAVETGKPLWEARTEASAVVTKVANSIEALMTRRWTTTDQMGDYQAVTRYRPHGVMLVLGPFNLPAHLPGAHIVPALLAGNTIVFKPSEWAVATGQWLAEAWQQVGLPPGVLNMLQGRTELAVPGVEHPDVAGILFTGSERAGVSIHRRLAGQPHKILALELGGNNPLVVHDVSDLQSAAVTTILSAFITAGQRCTCARRLIVTGAKNYERLVAAISEALPRVRVGLPLDDQQPFMGTLIHQAAAEQMLQAEKELVAAGATSVVPLTVSDRASTLLRPGLVAASASATIDDCERFGPLLLLYQAGDLDEAIALANQTKFGLSAGYLGDRVEDFYYFLHRVRAGVVNWNRQMTGASGKLPFGGVGASGNHRPSGFFAADYCSYPVASLESHELREADGPVPGLELI